MGKGHQHILRLPEGPPQRPLYRLKRRLLLLCAFVCLALLLWDCGNRTPLNECSISKPCPNGSPCVFGRCKCDAPWLTCGTACVNPTADVANCGTCGRACAPGQGCVESQCVGGKACPPGLVMCQGQCADLASNTQHCGACDRVCAATQSCVQGVCQCLTNEVPCQGAGGSVCANTQSDAAHCGVCGNACAQGQACASGVCAAGPAEPTHSDGPTNPDAGTGDQAVTDQPLPENTTDTPLLPDATPDRGAPETRPEPPVLKTWAKVPGSTSTQQGRAIAYDSKGNIFVTGYISGQVTFGGTSLSSNGGRDIFVAKLDSSGNWLWAKNVGSPADDEGYAIAVDASGNAYVTGYFRSNMTHGSIKLTAKAQDIFLLKFAPDGAPLGARQAGGPADDIGYGIAVDKTGDVVLTGFIRLTADFGGKSVKSRGGQDVFVAKVSGTTGDWMWAIQGGSVLSDVGYGVVVDAMGSAYVTGYYRGKPDFGATKLDSESAEDILVAKISSTGQWVWAKSAGDGGRDEGRAIAIDNQGGLYIVGSFIRDAKFGPAPKLDATGGQDIFVAKMDNLGAWKWAQKAGGRNTDAGHAVAIDSLGNLTIAGSFQGSATFGGNSLTSKGGIDAFVGKLTGSGNWLWARRGGGTLNDEAFGVAVDSGSNPVLTGYFFGSADFGTHTIKPNAGIGIFVWRSSP